MTETVTLTPRHTAEFKRQLIAVPSFFLRASNHYPLSAESCKFPPVHIHSHRIYWTYSATVSCRSVTDDSEEWTGDDEEPISPPPETAGPLASM